MGSEVLAYNSLMFDVENKSFLFVAVAETREECEKITKERYPDSKFPMLIFGLGGDVEVIKKDLLRFLVEDCKIKEFDAHIAYDEITAALVQFWSEGAERYKASHN